MNWLIIVGIVLYMAVALITAANFYQMMVEAEKQLWKSVKGKGIFALIIGAFWPIVFSISIIDKLVRWILTNK